MDAGEEGGGESQSSQGHEDGEVSEEGVPSEDAAGRGREVDEEKQEARKRLEPQASAHFSCSTLIFPFTNTSKY